MNITEQNRDRWLMPPEPDPAWEENDWHAKEAKFLFDQAARHLDAITDDEQRADAVHGIKVALEDYE